MPPLKHDKAEAAANNANNNQPSSKQLVSTMLRPFTCTAYSQKLLMNLNALREDGRFCDVDLIAGHVTLGAHRAVLSASSAYFEAMFRPELGLSEGKQRAVHIHSIDPEVLRQLLDFIYTAQIQINQTNVQEILAAADMLQLPEIVAGCAQFLCQELHVTNALGILRFAEAHHCEQLSKSAFNFIYTNFPQVAEEDELVDTPQGLFVRLLKSEYLRVDSETQVFLALLRWINHDIKQRRQYVFDMFTYVRLSLVPIHLIDGAIVGCQDMSLKIALRSIKQDLTSKRGQLVPLCSSPRVSARKCVYVIGGSSRETSTNWSPADSIFESIVKFDVFRQKWNETAPMEVGRILPGVAVLDGQIYVVGGERGSQILANGEVFDPQNDRWRPVAPMIVPRCEFGLCTLGGYLWAMGGWVGEDIGDSIECYDPLNDNWTRVDTLPEPRFSMGVVSFEGLIYCVGGCTTASRHLPDLIRYNPVTKEFGMLAPMRTARCQMGVTILGRHLYVVGGNSSTQQGLCTVERYSFDLDKWDTVQPMMVERASPAVASVDGHLFVFGGNQTTEINFYRAQVTISSVERYDPALDTWMDCPDLPVSRSEAGAAVI